MIASGSFRREVFRRKGCTVSLVCGKIITQAKEAHMLDLVRKIINLKKIITDLDAEIKAEIDRQSRGWTGE